MGGFASQCIRSAVYGRNGKEKEELLLGGSCSFCNAVQHSICARLLSVV